MFEGGPFVSMYALREWLALTAPHALSTRHRRADDLGPGLAGPGRYIRSLL